MRKEGKKGRRDEGREKRTGGGRKGGEEGGWGREDRK